MSWGQVVASWFSPGRLTLYASGMLLFFLGSAAVDMVSLIRAGGVVFPQQDPVGRDFMAFWSAGRLVLDGRVAEIHLEQPIHQMHQLAVACAPDKTCIKDVFLWHHPPPFLLVATALATLQYPFAVLTWFVVSAVFALMVIRQLLPGPRQWVLGVGFPSVGFHTGNVQAGLVVGGLFGLALHWLERRPLLAGVAIGCLAIKPHVAVLFPLVLLVQRRWPTFIAAAVTTLLILGATILAFGVQTYFDFFTNLRDAQGVIDNGKVSRLTIVSLQGNLITGGVSADIARWAHWLSAGAATVLVMVLWALRAPTAVCGAALAAAAVLIPPYLFYYDLTVLGVGLALFGVWAAKEGFRGPEPLVLAFAWLSPALTVALNQVHAIPLWDGWRLSNADFVIPYGPIAAWGVLLICAGRAGLFDGIGRVVARVRGPAATEVPPQVPEPQP